VARAIRIAHVADTHLGYRQYGKTDPQTGRNQRTVDIEKAYERIVDDILTRDVDLVMHAGDIFHHPRPSWSAIRAFVEQTQRIAAAGIPMVAIAGNHDMPRLRTSDSLFSILQLALPKVKIVAGYDLEEVPFPDLDVLIHAFPHGALGNPNAEMPWPRPKTRNILLTHGLLPTVELQGHRREPGEVEISAALTSPSLDYIALGHYHLWGAYGPNTYYSGSTERISWADYDATPGYNIITLGDSEPATEHVPIEVRPMRRLDSMDARGRSAKEIADAILIAAQRLRDPSAMVRVTLHSAERSTRREVEAIVRREYNNIVWSLEVNAPQESIFPVGSFNTVDVPDFSPLKLFEQFIEERQKEGIYTAEFAQAFRERGLQALRTATENAQATESSEEVPA